MTQKYTLSHRYDSGIRRQKILGLCSKCSLHGFAVACRIRSKNSVSLDIPLGMKYCTRCKCITLLDDNLAIFNKDGVRLK